MQDIYWCVYGSRDSSVGIMMGYGLNCHVRFPVWPGTLLHVILTGSGVHAASYPMGTEGSFPVVQRSGREADYSPQYSAEVRYGGAIPTFSHTSSWRGA
jgi:hypothetical protein